MLSKLNARILKPYDLVDVPGKARGSKANILYRLKRDENNNSVYVEVGQEDIQSYINSFKTGASLKSMLDRISLMPVRDKISYLQQTEDSFSADLVGMPKDGTEAFIMLSNLKVSYPDINKHLAAGKSFDEAISLVFGVKDTNQTSDPVDSEVPNA